MREGVNPASASPHLDDYLRHRIIIPVYIPTLDGYFTHALEVLSICLESVRLTAAGRASVTIISNGSCREVNEALDRYYQEGWIDQLLLNHSNRGKVDAVMSAARGSFEELITISDCDVLFRHGWLDAVGKIFQTFPECGIAAPIPRPMAAWSCTSATILGSLAHRELCFEKIVPDVDLDRFALSIGRADMFRDFRRAQMIVRRGDTTACIGCGHVVPTFRKDLIAKLPKQPSLLAYKAERDSIDFPSEKLGYWRLSTARGYAYHVGNTPEAWVYEELEQCRQDAANSAVVSSKMIPPSLPPLRRHWTGKLPWRLRAGLVKAARKSFPLVCRVRPDLRELCPGGVLRGERVMDLSLMLPIVCNLL